MHDDLAEQLIPILERMAFALERMAGIYPPIPITKPRTRRRKEKEEPGSDFSFGRCNALVPSQDDGLCFLQAGHRGKHAAAYPSEADQVDQLWNAIREARERTPGAKPKQCPAIHRGKFVLSGCPLPEGHEGPHEFVHDDEQEGATP